MIAERGKPILFWRETNEAPIVAFVQRLLRVDLPWPGDFVRDDISSIDRALLSSILAAGKRGIGYMGWADCRLCGEKLGTHDLHGYGFMWPERAEHYIQRHKVWTPDCDLLLVAAGEKPTGKNRR